MGGRTTLSRHYYWGGALTRCRTLISLGKHRQFIQPGSVRSPNSLRKQLGTQLLAGAEHAWQKTLLQLTSADPPGMGADIQRGQYLAGGVVHRHGDGTQALFQFLIDNAPALLPHFLQAFEQGLRGGEGAAGLG